MAKVNLATIPFFAVLTKKELNFVSTFLITKKYNQNEKSINSLDTTQSSDSDSESGNTNNWIQVSRKYTIKKLEN